MKSFRLHFANLNNRESESDSVQNSVSFLYD